MDSAKQMEMQQQFQDMVSKIEMKSAQRRWLDAADTCFNVCVLSLRHRELSERETECLSGCTDKFFHIHARCMLRFAGIDRDMQERQLKQESKWSEQELKLNAKLEAITRYQTGSTDSTEEDD